MNKKTMLLTKSLAGLLVFTLVAAGCTKKRNAALSDTDAPNTFAIADFGDVQDLNSAYSIQTEGASVELNKSNEAKAQNENGRSAVAAAKVPARLQFMFDNLTVTGQGNQSLPVTFGVDKDFVTVYKIVSTLNGLTALEKQYAQMFEQVSVTNRLARATVKTERLKLINQLQKVSANAGSQKAKNQGTFLVPIFKYAVTAYGTLQRTKNDLREETSNLTLMKTDWAQATHIQISARQDDSSPMAIDANDQETMDRTFSTSRLDRQIMTAGELKNIYQVPTDLQENDLIYTSLDDSGLTITQITQMSKLTQSQLDLLKTNGAYGKIFGCPKSVIEKLKVDKSNAVNDCVMVMRSEVPVNFVRVKIPVKDGTGNQTAVIKLDKVNYTENVGLVSIPQNVEPKRLATDDTYDSNSLLRVSDLKNKEFFFRRTLEDAPLTTSYMIGEAGSVQNVRFELQDNRLIVRRADKLIAYKKGSNDQEIEDLMSIPVIYVRREFKDARGTDYSYPRFVKTNKETAEYVYMNWAQNTLPASDSPIAYYGGGQCIKSTADTVVTDVDNRFDKGVLNFSFQYTVAMEQSEACLGIYNGVGDYNIGSPNHQNNARLKERISFKVNDGSTDKSYVAQVPFRAQNALGYGVWTIGQINPDEHGLHGREGTQTDMPVVQDFRNGRKVIYTLTGMPADQARKKLYVDTTREIVEAWNQAYKRAFKGTELERSGNYLEVQVNGDDGVQAHLGDLDRNIIHFENKVNDSSSTLGVSQVGYNLRSGIVVADSLIVFAGNLENYVASLRRNLKIVNQYRDMIEKFKKEALAELKTEQDASKKPADAPTVSPTTPAEVKKLIGDKKASFAAPLKNVNLRNLRASSDLTRFVQENSSRLSKFNFGTAQMENAFIERVLRKALESSDVDAQDLEGLMAQEMLVSLNSKLGPQDKANLQRRVSLMNVRNQMREHYKNRPGCLLTMREGLGRSFANDSFESAFVSALHFDLGHEMGHSQGLTHNFIGSYDRANFTDEGLAAGENLDKASRNYSSIMDYINPPQLKWDGIGTYDVHALRASHTGLLELSETGIKALQAKSAGALVVNGKFIHVNSIQKVFAATGWTSFSIDKLGSLLRPFKYCTDIDVGYEPVCQRFDMGTTPSEIVDNLALDYEENYINNYYGWDRYDFGYRQEAGALSRTMSTMINMRQFLDETFYKFIIEKSPEGSDYAQGALKAYFFLNQMIHSPDATVPFMSKDRFVATRVETKDDAGNAQTTVAIIEKRALQDIQANKLRLDTIGVENDKVMAMQLLTLKGLPYSKYAQQSFIFSFVDFEKYLMGMQPNQSLILNTFKSIFLNNLQPTFSLPNAPFQAASGLQANVTAAIRAYAGISAILSLEVSTLRDTDNFANLFKVANVVGTPPSDRISLTQLGVSKASQAGMSYYALDSATMAQDIMKSASQLDFFIRNTALDTAMFNLVDSEMDAIVASLKDPKADLTAAQAKISDMKAKLVLALNEQNKDGAIVSTEMAAANPGLTMEALANIVDQINMGMLTRGIGILQGNAQAKAQAETLAKQANMMAEQMPLFGNAQKAIIKVVTAKNLGDEKTNLKGVLSALLTSSEANDTKYGIIMNNVDFLSRLTRMTNPDYFRK